MHCRFIEQFLWRSVCNLISLQPPLSTRSLSVVTLSPQPSPPWKSHIAHLDMHHLVFGINFQIHSVSLTIFVSIHLLIYLSTRGRWKCGSGKCRSDKVWKAVRIEKTKMPEVYDKTKRTHEQRPDVHIQAVTDSRFEQLCSSRATLELSASVAYYRLSGLPVNVWYVRILNFLFVCRTFIQFAPCHGAASVITGLL